MFRGSSMQELIVKALILFNHCSIYEDDELCVGQQIVLEDMAFKEAKPRISAMQTSPTKLYTSA